MKINTLASMTLIFILAACGSISAPTTAPTALTPTLTFTPIPTDTPIPTYTPSSTLTPSPAPTETESPTVTAGPSPSPIKATSKNAVLVPDIGSTARSIVWSPDGNYLYIGTYDKGVAIYDVDHKKLLSFVGNTANVSSLAISPDGKTLAVGIATDGSIRLWDVENVYPKSEVTIFPAHGDDVFDPDVLGLDFSPDGKLIASSGFDGKVIVWDVGTGDMIKKLDVQDSVFEVVFSPDGKNLIAGLSVQEEFDIWSSDTWELQNTLKADQAWDLSISPDGSKIVSAGGGIHEANLWDVKTGKLLFNFQKETDGFAEAVSYAPSGNLVALGGGGGIVYLWDASTGNLAKELHIDNEFNGVSALAFSPDGTQIATAGSQVIIWNLDKP